MGLKILQDRFENTDNDFVELELEPVWETANEAIKFEQEIKNCAFKKGYDYGYKEGFYDGRCPEKRPKFCYGCGHCCHY